MNLAARYLPPRIPNAAVSHWPQATTVANGKSLRSGQSAQLECSASLLDNPLGIPCHFPQMPVRVLEVASVTTPKGVVRWFYDDCTSPLGLGHDLVDFALGGHVVPNGALG
jgi:hypothetical protein